jgi:hypothetical protein
MINLLKQGYFFYSSKENYTQHFKANLSYLSIL